MSKINIMNQEWLEECIKSNTQHLEVLNKEHADLCKEVTEIKTNVSWLMKSYWVIATASIGGLVAGVLNLLIK